MMKIGLVLFFAVACLAQEQAPRSAAASQTKYTAQELFLAKRATTNFACRVNEVRVRTDSRTDVDTVKADDLRAALANVATLEWAHIAQTSFSALDGRNDEKVLGTPGGDMGEFIQGLTAFTKVTGRALSAEEVQDIFSKYLKVMSKEKFQYMTDEKAYMRIAVATGCRNLHVAEMGGMRRKRANYLEVIATPEYIGDPFIRFLAANFTALDMDQATIANSLSAYHNVLWTAPSEPSRKLCYLSLKGPHKEAALVNIKASPYCTDQGLAPMVSPMLTAAAPVMINHPEAAKVLRRELVAVIADWYKAVEGADVESSDVLAMFNSIAEGNLDKFWASFGAGLPTFSVEFANAAPVLTGNTE